MLITFFVGDLGFMEIQPLDRNLPLIDALNVSFEDVMVAREMRQFSRALGLVPNVSGKPSMGVVAAIVFGRTSLKAVLRRELGDAQFRNLQNYALGKVKSSRTIGLDVAGLQELDEEQLRALMEMLMEVLRDPENASLTRLITMVEGAAYRLFTAIRSEPVHCPHCKANTILTTERWWARQACNLGLAEMRLIDRSCMVAIAIQGVLRWSGKGAGSRRPTVQSLVSPEAHPNANWLNVVASFYRAESLASLAIRAGTDLKDDTIWRHARGEMLTPETVEKLLRNVSDHDALTKSAVTVRTLAFAIEFLQAANRDYDLKPEVARKIISARVQTLQMEFNLGVSKFAEVILKKFGKP